MVVMTGNRAFLEVASMVVTEWIVAFLCSEQWPGSWWNGKLYLSVSVCLCLYNTCPVLYNYSTVRGDGGSRIGEVRAGTTSPMPEHKEFGVLCCLTTPGLRKDIRRQIRQLYSHKNTYYVHYNYILSSHLLSHFRIYFYY